MQAELETINERADEAAGMLKLLSHPGRLRVLCRLIEGEMTAGNLAQAVGMSQSALSQHLSRMRDQGLLGARREGNQQYYRITNPDCEALLNLLHNLYCAPGNNYKSV